MAIGLFLKTSSVVLFLLMFAQILLPTHLYDRLKNWVSENFGVIILYIVIFVVFVVNIPEVS